MERYEAIVPLSIRDKLERIVPIGASILAFAGGAAMAREARSAEPGTKAPAPKTFDVFTHTDTEGKLKSIEKVLFPESEMVVNSLSLSKDSLIAVGDCVGGSTYSKWEETPAYIKQTKCSDVTETTIAQPDPNTSVRFSNVLKTTGFDLVNSVPGQSVDVRQKSVSLNANKESIFQVFSCPSPKSKKSVTSIQSVSAVKANGTRDNGKISFCPSNKNVHITSNRFKKSNFIKSFNKYAKDKYRHRYYSGDFYKYLMFDYCDDGPKDLIPETKFNYLAQKGAVRTSFRTNWIPYCDELGRFTSEATAQVKSGGKFRNIGKTVVHLDGLSEILALGYGYNYDKYGRAKVLLPSVGKLCKGGKNIQMRIKLTSQFVANQKQDFQPGEKKVKSSKKTNYSEAKNIC